MTDPPLNPFSAPQTSDPVAPPPPPAPGAATQGQRIAGALLVANAILVLAESFVLGDTPSPGMPRSPVGMIVPAAIDGAIGASLLAGSRKVVPWAIVRAALGLVVHGGLRIAANDPVSAVLAVIVSAALLALLIGDAGRLRVTLGASAFGLDALLEIVGLAGAVRGSNYLAGLIMSASGDVEPGPAGRVQGQGYPYTITAPSDAWRLRKDAAVKKDNPIVDRWLVRPDKDAHLLIIEENVAGANLQIEAYADAIVKNARDASTRFELVRRVPLPGHPDDGRLIRARATREGMDLEYCYGIIAGGERAFQLIGFAAQETYPSVEAELLGMIGSFDLPPGSLQPFVPPDVDPEPAGRVQGLSYGYTVDAPGGAWHVRKDDAVKKDNALVDRWLVRLDRDAHVIIIIEHVPGAVIPIEPYVDEVMKGAKETATAFAIDAREPLPSNPDNGRLLRVRATVQDLDLEYRYALVTAGDRGFQVIAFAERAVFPGVEAEMMKIIDSFKLP